MHRRFLSTLAVSLVLAGCLASPPAYHERYELTHLTVVLMDPSSLRERYERVSGRGAVKILGSDAATTFSTVRGFFDPATNTIYCSKMDFAICGHELHHALLGSFHPHE